MGIKRQLAPKKSGARAGNVGNANPRSGTRTPGSRAEANRLKKIANDLKAKEKAAKKAAADLAKAAKSKGGTVGGGTGSGGNSTVRPEHNRGGRKGKPNLGPKDRQAGGKHVSSDDAADRAAFNLDKNGKPKR